eukprot:38771-Hanusia_phi.AAC.4
MSSEDEKERGKDHIGTGKEYVTSRTYGKGYQRTGSPGERADDAADDVNDSSEAERREGGVGMAGEDRQVKLRSSSCILHHQLHSRYTA